MKYEIVFTVLNSAFRYWYFPLFGFPFLAVTILLLRYNQKKTIYKTIGFFGLCITLIYILSTSYLLYYKAYIFQEVLKNKKYKITEGKVENFESMPKGGHKDESFSVNGLFFRYSDFGPTPAFNNTQIHGGPIKEGLFVRIYYVIFQEERKIIQLEVKKR